MDLGWLIQTIMCIAYLFSGRLCEYHVEHGDMKYILEQEYDTLLDRGLLI